ncbi:unnamed protein product [Mytilus coruscus]|uniref:Uncharacterized protein n=1 Tax=Mytilus coruscus TaxID=42192 RepID=A0A6J8E4P9_MYTCO|nr:unnamed protein product [Mytilus coruscus]
MNSEVVGYIHCHLNNNHKNVTEQVKEFEKLSMYGNIQIQKSIADQSRTLKHQHATTQAEMIKIREKQEKMEDKHEKTNEEIIKMRELQEVLMQLLINKVRVEVNYDDPGQKNPSDKMAKEFPVLIIIKTPRGWNDKAIAEALKDPKRMPDKQDFQIKFVREGSLIILTTVPYGILYDKFKYEHAIKMFLTRMMDVCNIDTERACHVKATLHILERDEVNIQHSYVLCEDKSTQMNIPHADKCFQINSYERDERMDPKELERKIIKLNEGIDDDNFESRLYSLQRSDDETSYHSPSRSSSSIPSLPVDDVIYSNSNPNIYGEVSVLLSTSNFATTTGADSTTTLLFTSNKSGTLKDVSYPYLKR